MNEMEMEGLRCEDCYYANGCDCQYCDLNGICDVCGHDHYAGEIINGD